MNHKCKLWVELVVTGLLVLTAVIVLFTRNAAPAEPLFPATLKTADRLAEPPLPENPTQFERGRYLYWLNCMPCHGDRGQGLTAEFRSLYVEDQNCWARGCHAGRMEDQGFPLPRTIPAIISANRKLPPFATPDKLFEFLRTTHPPQHPGILTDNQYWAISNYLLVRNKRLSPGQVLGPDAQTSEPGDFWRFTTAGALLLLAAGIVVWLARRWRPGQLGKAGRKL
jgi:mono/diheme cytochrome c family protein